MNLEEFLNQLNFNDVQKNNDYLFSDLEDEDEPIQRKPSESITRKDSFKSQNEIETPLPKVSRASRKKSVISSSVQP